MWGVYEKKNLSQLIFNDYFYINFGSFPLIGNVNAANLSGSITSDITWTKTDGPISLTGTVTVTNGVTLTIEAGTVVHLNGYSIKVDGTLHAIGSSLDDIEFNSGT
ncbi:MAG: hypothetical protein NWF01_04820 [Candidatus Bathyarchaeota archaeon]|nr:hypothetical protein [Candidatus Bathyarchaeota archaeon]